MKTTDDELFETIEVIESEMIAMWTTGDIVPLLEKDIEFVQVLLEGIALEIDFWQEQMPVGKA